MNWNPSPENCPASQIRQKSTESTLYFPAGQLMKEHVLLDKGGDWRDSVKVVEGKFG